MPTLREAIFWNLASSPFRLAIGVAHTAVLARALYGSDGAALATFALLTSVITTFALISGVGMPQIFSKVVAGHVVQKNSNGLASFLAATALIRVCSWLLAGVMTSVIATEFSDILPSTLKVISDKVLLASWLLWGLFFDLSGFSGRCLSSAYEQKWQNIINAASQAVGALVSAAGLVVTEYSLLLCVFGMMLIYLCRLTGHSLLILRLIRDRRKWKLHAGFCIWRTEAHQLGHATVDKTASYFLSPAFLLIVAGYVMPSTAVASLFLVLDLASKLIAVLSVPVSGLVLPAFRRAYTHGIEKVREAMTLGRAAANVVGTSFVLLIGALVFPVGELMYGKPFAWSPLVVCLIMGLSVIEFMVLEFSAAYLTAIGNIRRLWLVKLGYVSLASFIAGGVLIATSSPEHGVVAFFGVRMLLLPMLWYACDIGLAQIGKIMIPITGIAFSIVIASYSYDAGASWQWKSAAVALLYVLGIGMILFSSLLMSDLRTLARFWKSPLRASA